MATVVVTLSGVALTSSTAAPAAVISDSVRSGGISDTDPTNVVLPTPNPPAITIFAVTGARVRSSCQALRLPSGSDTAMTPTPESAEPATPADPAGGSAPMRGAAARPVAAGVPASVGV